MANSVVSHDDENHSAAGGKSIPRVEANDYTNELAVQRRAFIHQRTGADLSHVAQYSFDPIS